MNLFGLGKKKEEVEPIEKKKSAVANSESIIFYL